MSTRKKTNRYNYIIVAIENTNIKLKLQQR